jgi:ATP-dependent exoDNAse (exonuclease V) beta subunit
MLSQLKEQLSSAKSQQDKFIESLQKQQGEEMAQEKARLEAQLRHVEAVDETLKSKSWKNRARGYPRNNKWQHSSRNWNNEKRLCESSFWNCESSF